MKNILEYLEYSAERCPDKIAVDDGTVRYTYKELLQLSRKIGSAISHMVRPEQPVPVMMDKSADTLAIFMGIVQAGCFYVSVNPVQPDVRVAQILGTLNASVIVTLPELEERIRTSGYQGCICFVEELKSCAEEQVRLTEIRERVIDTNILYAMFTSGSTGVPKGVLVSHRAVIDFIGCFTDIFELSQRDVIANQAPFDFDVSVKDIYSAFKIGATLVIVPTALFSTPPRLLDYLCEKKATVLIWAVSALCLVSALRGLDYKVPDTVQKILFSGEAMPVKQLNIWRKYLPDTQFVNLYGPTEITCNCTWYKIEREFDEQEKIPIGCPFPNRKVFLLGEKNELITEPGVRGEICVTGTSLASGYYNNPEQTARSFVPNPLQENYTEWMYRTGDLASYNEAGELCFGGRRDFQIKHMGHRIELEEIEIAINAVDGVDRGYCVFEEERNRIVAYYVGERPKKEIRACLLEKLPSYMVPNLFQQIDEIPMTKNGKIDRGFFLRQKAGKK